MARENGSELDEVKKVFEVATVDASDSFVSDTPEVSDDQTGTEAPYHVFTIRKKWQVVFIVSLAGLFFSLSSNIYFPALPAIAAAIDTDISLVSFTVTIYMIFQGLAPSLWGPLSDMRGRRMTFICTFVVYLLANIGLAFSKDLASLMVFRALQAIGTAATISVGAGVIGDITTVKERGGFLGIFGGLRMLGQSVGPVIGGFITEYRGFHGIFWFLVILVSLTLTLTLIVVFLPETLRSIAGNGTVRLTGIHRPLILRSLSRDWHDNPASHQSTPRSKFAVRCLLVPFVFLAEKDVACTLLFGAIVYTVWSMIASSTAALFHTRFGLSNFETGLIFLPNGVACILGTMATGAILNRDYRLTESSYLAAQQLPPGTKLDHSRKHLADFPVSRARLRSSWFLVPVFVISVAGYSFTVDSPRLVALRKPGVAPALALQALIAFTSTAIYTQNSALMVDLYPGASASATAVNNLARCLIGAAGVAAVQFIVNEVGEGPAFVGFAGVVVLFCPLLAAEWLWRERWRRERLARLEGKQAAEGGEKANKEDV
ncbi:major facilitator superfamily domain-containing protein [Schizothecium vesticola]|uniref:Major facilitator superfamily domain-containing protein n=1 Tax=Schizothecium vesticola TaxID=314040 RepID=A0AA40K4M3_9PEZI|nr:major facilitator superfamily domain-containing protein [Schizothecium vesticola]